MTLVTTKQRQLTAHRRALATHLKRRDANQGVDHPRHRALYRCHAAIAERLSQEIVKREAQLERLEAGETPWWDHAK